MSSDDVHVAFCCLGCAGFSSFGLERQRRAPKENKKGLKKKKK
jgi:hypothetical protein